MAKHSIFFLLIVFITTTTSVPENFDYQVYRWHSSTLSHLLEISDRSYSAKLQTNDVVKQHLRIMTFNVRNYFSPTSDPLEPTTKKDKLKAERGEAIANVCV